MKPSYEPPFWLLFGGGGLLAALVGPALVFIVGIALPLGWLPVDASDPQRLRAVVAHPIAFVALEVVIAGFLFHGCHRILHTLYDLGLPRGPLPAAICYGIAAIGSLVGLAVLGLLAAGQ